MEQERRTAKEPPIVTFDLAMFFKALIYTLTGLGIGYYIWG
jgi:hypothetical protein